MVYPALLSLMRTPRLPIVDWTDAPADLNGLVRFAERRNLVSARVITFHTQSTRVCLTPVALYQCLMACVSSNRVLDPEHTLHYNASLCISICEVITCWGWCRIESHSQQCNMFIVYRAREVQFTCARLYWLECDCLLIESDCHVLCRLRSLLSAKSNRKCLPLLRYWTHQINCHDCVAPRKA